MGQVGGGGVFTIQTSFKPLLLKGGREGEEERRLLAPNLFCTPAILLLKSEDYSL
jgi:hypothetical protein